MARKRVKVNEIEKYLLKPLEEWGELTMSDIRQKVDEYGDELVKQVKEDAPIRTGSYKKNWKVKHEGLNTAHYKALIYNKDHYRLTHLLEYGHVTRDGTKRTKAIPHLLKNEEKITKDFIDDIGRLFGE